MEASGGKLTNANHLVKTYIKPLLLKEFRTLKDEMGEGAFLGNNQSFEGVKTVCLYVQIDSFHSSKTKILSGRRGRR